MAPANLMAQRAMVELFGSGQGRFEACVHKPRNYGFHQLAHHVGLLVSANVPGFEGLDPHDVIKRLQIESGIECDYMAIQDKGLGPDRMYQVRLPRSMSFDAMDEPRFRRFIYGICAFIVKRYWPGCTAEEVEDLATQLAS